MTHRLGLDYLVTLDFETYFDTQYSLRNLTYIQYIQDPQFHIYGASIQINDSKPIWYQTKKDLTQALQEIPWQRAGMIGHNLHFDGLVCAKKFDVYPKVYLDTLAMARGILPTISSHSLGFLCDYFGIGQKQQEALHSVKGKLKLTKEEYEALAKYCKSDVKHTWELYKLFIDYMPDEELELIDITLRMQTQPQLKIVVSELEQIIDNLIETRHDLLEEANLDIQTVRSSIKFADHLRSLGVEPPTKTSLNTGKETFAFAKTDLGMQLLFNHPDKEVRKAAEARVNCMSSIDITRAERFIEIANCNDEFFPVPLNYYGAHTGRWSGGDKVNPQNLSKKSGIRRCLRAPTGHLVLAADQSQIEARITGWLADHTQLLKDFEAHDKKLSKYDVYEIMASKVYSVLLDKVTSDQRFIGKMCVLGLGYGMGYKKLCVTLNQIRGAGSFDEFEAKHMVDTYRNYNRPIVDLWNELTNVLYRMAHHQEGVFKILTFDKTSIRLPNGMFLQYPNLNAVPNEFSSLDYSYEYKGNIQNIYGGRLTENIVQALARTVISNNMRKINKKFRIATMTHDEIVIVPPKGRIDEAREFVTEVMTTPPDWAPDLPLAIDVEIDERYSKD